ncbi:hypothetical protein NE237_017174 [Protea cynaroides]|uniref:Uncharacterized protein n=1 Tax=Protea cynaroides TaxID=273540 RepID=A0A9Q0QMM5_9MAGN|nr:hypothetical protein NE237_017174 [Protea cynaroides]
MTQKANLFKGQQKHKSIPPNRHGKQSQIRKGKRSLKPSKITKDMDADREVHNLFTVGHHQKSIKACCNGIHDTRSNGYSLRPDYDRRKWHGSRDLQSSFTIK